MSPLLVATVVVPAGELERLCCVAEQPFGYGAVRAGREGPRAARLGKRPAFIGRSSRVNVSTRARGQEPGAALVADAAAGTDAKHTPRLVMILVAGPSLTAAPAMCPLTLSTRCCVSDAESCCRARRPRECAWILEAAIVRSSASKRPSPSYAAGRECLDRCAKLDRPEAVFERCRCCCMHFREVAWRLSDPPGLLFAPAPAPVGPARR